MTENYKSFKKFVWTAMKNCTKDSIVGSRIGEKISSPEFSVKFGNEITKWYLALYPNGLNSEPTSNIGLFLVRLGNYSTFDIKYKFKIMTKSGELEMNRSRTSSAKDMKIGGFPKFISHEDLMLSEDEIIQDGKLTIICELTMTSPYPRDNTKFDNSTGIQGIQNMFEDENFVDFEIKCNDKEALKCHKFILAARSPVFLAMLTTGMSETQKGSVEIEEFDSEVMKQLLRFIYFHEIENLKEIATKLVIAADKYMIDDLKEICIENIIENLTRDNVIEVIYMTKNISDSDRLFSECVDVVMREYSFIKKTPDWENLPKHFLLKVIDETMQYNSEVENV